MQGISEFGSFNFQMTGFAFGQAHLNATAGLEALQTLSKLDTLVSGGALSANFSAQSTGLSQCGCIPPPRIEHCGAPTGKGLTEAKEFGPNAWRTAGGYVIKAEGNCSWKIYGPGAKPGDKALTHVHGDPHVDEKDGTRWDFTKDSDFVLPDGTRIHCDTSAETGQSVSQGLTIVNGADRVTITGVNGGCPTSKLSHDGYEWRVNHTAEGLDTYHLGGNSEQQSWFLERGGQLKGEVTGAYYDRATNRYEQRVDDNKSFWVDRGMRPPVGSAAWGNLVHNLAADTIGKTNLPGFIKDWLGRELHNDHDRNAVSNLFSQLGDAVRALGGLVNIFSSFGQAQAAVQESRQTYFDFAQLNVSISVGRLSAAAF